ncbi:MAG: hypothetical protein M1826_002568 [Phylliscum demangeonii]|nr:MAG: hypothetical protein M1826_002568 [Phylliscum demangeonii]
MATQSPDQPPRGEALGAGAGAASDIATDHVAQPTVDRHILSGTSATGLPSYDASELTRRDAPPPTADHSAIPTTATAQEIAARVLAAPVVDPGVEAGHVAGNHPAGNISMVVQAPAAVVTGSGTGLGADVGGHFRAGDGEKMATSTPSTPDDSFETEKAGQVQELQRIQTAKTTESIRGMPAAETTSSGRHLTEAELIKVMSRRRTGASGPGSDDPERHEERAEIERLMSRMFGKDRQQSAEAQTRHVGLVFKNLTVTGMGLGAALQPTVGDVLLGIPRLLIGLFTKGPRAFGGKHPVRTILDDFTGCVRPGEMLLVLGRPGSGCSTLLKVLGNQRFGYEAVRGDVTYGGATAQEMSKNFRGDILYNPEDDLHYATLTVKETLTFALKTRTPGKASRAEGESRADYVAEFLRVVAKLFWIEHTMKTKVGNAFVRGVSGGEKKRVSIAEAMITKASTQCWDNSTRGLDASTALEYVQSLRTLTNMANVSSLVALYQAGESLYELFDKVVLLHEGRCAYYGTAEDARAYFEGLGFRSPPRCTTADFLTSVVDEHEREIQPGWEQRIPRTPDEFQRAYRNSEIYRKNVADIEGLETQVQQQERERHAALTKVTSQKNYTIPFHKQVFACTRRQFLVILGDRATLFGKWGGVTFQALIVGSTFYNSPPTSAGVFTRGGVLFLSLLFNALLALAELTAAYSGRPVMLKHKSFSFYRPAAYAIAQVVVDLPLVFVQVLIFDIIVYFLSNLRRDASAFFINYLIVYFATLTMYSFFRALGSLSRSLDVATRLTGISIQALVVYTGYLIPTRKMRPWFKWLIYINPIAYGYEALIANEFHTLQIRCVPPSLVPYGGNVLAGHQACTLPGSSQGATVVDGASYIKSAYNYSRSHLWRNLGIVIAFWLFFIVLTVIGVERQTPNRGGGAVTVFKRGQVPKSVEKAIGQGVAPPDEEKGARRDEASAGSDDVGAVVQGVEKNETIFTWTGVNYTIPIKGGERKLLQDVQGFVQPGRLTALMGASGAGKTTLLNVLAQRVNFGVVTGDFLVDGRPLPRSFQRATGFAEQQDVHEPTATVREALRFSALLRQPKEVPTAEKYAYVEKMIVLLEMQDIAGATIGEIGAGLNQEQRKRVTIGVELASKPELLMFLDEPTSGLDSGAAFNILRFLRKLADAGQAILCTIHQPSAILFEYFDDLLLLKSGGRVVYHGALGSDSRTMIGYFERNGAKKCAPKANPAEYMLEAIGAGNPDYSGKDWGDVWAASPEREVESQAIREMVESRRNSSSAVARLQDDREFAMPLTTQMMAVIRRSFVAYWRSPDYIVGKFILHIFTGLFNTFTFYKLGHSSIDMQSRLFSVFMTLTISPPLIQQLQPKFLQARNIYKARESNSKIYSWRAFALGAILAEMPYSIVAGTLYFNCWYWGVGFPRDSFSAGFTWMSVMLFEVYYVGFGQAIASFSPNELLASILVPVFFLFVVAFCGIIVPYMALPYFWRSWMYHLSPFRYLLENLLGVVVHKVPVVCADNEYARFTPPPGQSCLQYTQEFVQRAGGYVREQGGLCLFCQYTDGDQFAAGFNVFYYQKWRNFGILWAFCLFNFALVFICTGLYLGGGRRIKAWLSPSVRRQRKALKG